MRKERRHALVPQLHLGPLTPNLREILDGLEIDFRRFLEDFPRAFNVPFSLASSSAVLIEFGKVDEEAVKVRSCFSRADSLDGIGVCLCNLDKSSHV